jgi:copper chaperone
MSDNEKETILSVEGMTCSACIRHVERALHALDGVDRVDVDPKVGEVRVEHDARASIDQMIAALDDTGYEARAGARYRAGE